MEIELKTNGFTAKKIQPLKEVFEKAVEKLFPGCKLFHFYYGELIDMADIVIKPGVYAHFSITEKRISLNGYTCSDEELDKFQSLTYKDSLYRSKLFEIAEVEE